PTSATTCMSASTLRDAAKPIRTMKWSSTTRIRICLNGFICSVWFYQNDNPDACSRTGLAFEFESTAHRLRPLPHVQQSEMAGGGTLCRVKPAPIIANAKSNAVKIVLQFDGHVLGMAMVDGIRHCLLSDAK